ncbi:DUF4149 domain-containing protein [Sulfurimonas sp.]|nr:DUF4149 domain-containing protein [Sulfurimonas sp.]
MRTKIYIDFTYLILLAASFGGIIVLGAFVAPVIFHTDRLFSDVVLGYYNSGMIMGEIFHRFSYWVYVLAFSVMVYEAVMYKMGHRDTIAIISAFVVSFTSLMYSGVYAPKILAMQELGVEATLSDTFKNVHVASEIDFKILAVALIVLFVRRLMLLRLS